MRAPVSRCRRPRSNASRQDLSPRGPSLVAVADGVGGRSRLRRIRPFFRSGSQRPESIAMVRASDPVVQENSDRDKLLGGADLPPPARRRSRGMDRRLSLVTPSRDDRSRSPPRPRTSPDSGRKRSAFRCKRKCFPVQKPGARNWAKRLWLDKGSKDACRAQAGAWVFSEPAEENMTAFCACAYGVGEGIRFIRSGPWWRNGPTRQSGRSSRPFGNWRMSSLEFPSSAYEKPS